MNKYRLITFLLVFLVFGAAPVYAPPPAWWSQPATQVIDPNATPNSYAPANLGQLKKMAKQARLHLDNSLPGGAQTVINSMVDGFVSDPASNYSPITLGQLKKVGKPFYDRLIAAGFQTKQLLIAHGYPTSWAYTYPWNPGTPVNDNYRPANIGQLKAVFSFDVTMGFDGDGMNDAWETKWGRNPLVWNNPNLDSDGDLMSDGDESRYGRNPNAGVTVSPAPALIVFTPLE